MKFLAVTFWRVLLIDSPILNVLYEFITIFWSVHSPNFYFLRIPKNNYIDWFPQIPAQRSLVTAGFWLVVWVPRSGLWGWNSQFKSLLLHLLTIGHHGQFIFFLLILFMLFLLFSLVSLAKSLSIVLISQTISSLLHWFLLNVLFLL